MGEPTPMNPGTDPPKDPQLGGPCSDDEQCDDAIDCTIDVCDTSVGRCRFAPENSRCADDVYCDGIEICTLGVGCTEGEPVTCSDDSTCTIDRCDEETKSCESRERDADGDGDPVWNCLHGTDCDDTNPRVSGKTLETCGNNRDDDCDGEVDEEDCTTPLFDTCLDPMSIEGPGTYELSLASASQDFTLSCVENVGTRRDGVATLVVPDGPSVDVDLTATSERGEVALALFGDCTDSDSESACAAGVPFGAGEGAERGSIARLIARGLAPGAHPLVVSGVSDATVTLGVRYGDVLPAPENETCGTAIPLEPDVSVEVTLAGAASDVASECGETHGDVVYRFTLDEARDIALNVAPLDERGEPSVSLRDEGCQERAAELSCRAGGARRLFARALPPGTYYAVIGSTGPGDVAVRLDELEATEAIDGEGCERPIAMELGRTQNVDFSARTDAVRTECSAGSLDATFALELEETSDVLLVERLSAGDEGALSLFGSSCDPEQARVCTPGKESPLRSRAFGVPKGEYRVVAESALGNPVSVTAFARRSRPTLLVGLGDHCDDAVRIPEGGGRFAGNTANARADFEASCDFGGSSEGGAPDQLLLLSLSRSRRVVFDLGESSYTTLLVLREATACPGAELPGTCVPGLGATRSFLDTTLPAGDYFVQIDGYNLASGAWSLDVFVGEPGE